MPAHNQGAPVSAGSRAAAFRACVLLAALHVAGGCATLSRGPGTESLEARVARYWSLRQGKDLSGIYPLYSSGYRAQVPREEFLKMTRLIRFDVLGFRVVRVSPAAESAEVTVAVRFVAPKLLGEMESEHTEAWVREDNGSWYKLDEMLDLPGFLSPGPPP